jgi:selenium metabolism protein YedF
MRIVDTRGQLCPAPIIAAKRALKETVAGESFIVLTDNSTSYNNLCRFLKDNKAGFTVDQAEGAWKLTVTRVSNSMPQTKPQDYCTPVIPHFEKGDYIVVISSEVMGEGDKDLGRLLTLNFIKALKDLNELPGRLILYNSGVKLAVNDSPVIEHLKDLEKMGVELVLCATCVAHYKLEQAVAAGILGNMFTIAEMMASAGKIIKP